MPYRITTDHDIIVIKISGNWSGDEGRQAQKETSELCRELNCKGILVDLREGKVTAEPADIFEVTAGHADVFPLGTRHAMLISKSDASWENADFFSDIAANRGIPARFFDDRDEAVRWLRRE